MRNQTKKSNTSLILGLILGFVLALITVYGYAINNDLYFSYLFLAIVLLLPIIIGIISSVKAKNEAGGFISLKNALKNFILSVSIGLLISTIVGILIFNVVDPDFKEVVRKIQVDGMEKVKEDVISKMYNNNIPESTIEKQEAKFDRDIEKLNTQDTYGVSKQIQYFIMLIAVYSFIGLIVALIVKKKDVHYNS